MTYSDAWRDAINDAYTNAFELWPEDFQRRTLIKAAACLRDGVPATFTADELDVVRHLMPAHGVHQSGAKRWALEIYFAG